MHKELLIEKRNRVDKLIAQVEKTLDSIDHKKERSHKEMFEGFDIKEIEKHKEKYTKETKDRYGHTNVYKESVKKTSKYTKEDWARIFAEKEIIDQKIINNMDKGPKDLIVQEEIEKLRQHITSNYYNCTVEIFRGLGDLYVQDERFTKNIDKNKPGYAAFLREAIHYYCDQFK
jgi:hypothetical protein